MLRQSRRSLQTVAPSKLLYGWGQAQALPLSKTNRVYTEPVCLNHQADYALNGSDISHVAAGWGHSLISTRSHVHAFGLNRSGQLGCDNHTVITLGENTTTKFLACGREHSHVVIEDGASSLYSFGNNMYGQLGLGKCKATSPGKLVKEDRPRKVSGYEGSVRHIVCGLDHTVFATECAVYAMGWGADGQLGLDKAWSADVNIPKPLQLDPKIKRLACSTDYTLALMENRKLWTWGNSEYGQGMQGAKIDRILEPIEIKTKGILDIAAGGPFSVVLTEDGDVYTCGYGALGLGPSNIETLNLKRVEALRNVSRIFATTDYAAAITAFRQRSHSENNSIHQDSLPFQELGATPRARGPPKKFRCTGHGDCQMEFTRSEHLARHQRKHTGEKPFKCVVEGCDRMFSRFDNMMQHTHTHNKGRTAARRGRGRRTAKGRMSSGFVLKSTARPRKRRNRHDVDEDTEESDIESDELLEEDDEEDEEDEENQQSDASYRPSIRLHKRQSIDEAQGSTATMHRWSTSTGIASPEISENGNTSSDSSFDSNTGTYPSRYGLGHRQEPKRIDPTTNYHAGKNSHRLFLPLPSAALAPAAPPSMTMPVPASSPLLNTSRHPPMILPRLASFLVAHPEMPPETLLVNQPSLQEEEEEEQEEEEEDAEKYPREEETPMRRRLSIQDLCNPTDWLSDRQVQETHNEEGNPLTYDEMEALQGFGRLMTFQHS
ncbi:hypothetical protein EC973_002130 [Apophysomyces ossiformis]|uniref:C2H2-type domain-containing protein n=1 Tax=Apophysomyces ossiformis TaxID=679940 RepID=A0A8H7ENU9_9FUNG|nr:hypothetical protein EC973_002130 [Apophysomyces ossiformis]